jgi:hypothetical protein
VISRSLLVFAVLTCLCAAACGDGDSTNACQVAPASGTAEAAGALTYSVSVTGAAQVSSIVYTAPTGEVELEAPTLPFQVTLQVAAGASLHIEALGSAQKGGVITASYRLVEAGSTTPVLGEASCAR